MAQVEQHLWWYRTLHRLVLNAVEGHPSGRQVRLLDAGCGTGGLLSFLRQRGFEHLRGFDVSPDAVQICRQRALPVELADLRQLQQVVAHQSAEAVVSNDTLYFFTVQEQAELLQRFWEILVPGGLLILNFPALSCFQGMHDVSVGIQRRFTKPEVQRLFSCAPFEIARLRFWPFLLSPLIYMVRLSQRVRLRCTPSLKIRSDVTMPPPGLNRLFAGVTRLENALFPSPPFGSSIFVVAMKTRR